MVLTTCVERVRLSNAELSIRDGRLSLIDNYECGE